MKLNMKLSLLSVALLGLAACGSGGGSGNGLAANHTNDSATSSTPITHPITSNAVLEDIKVEKRIFWDGEEFIDGDRFIVLNKEYRGKEIGEKVVLDLFPRYQLTQANLSGSTIDEGKYEPVIGFWRVYNQIYSGVVGYNEYYTINSTDPNEDWGIFTVVGRNTSLKELPTEKSATYKGVAFDHQEQGKLTYQVDFAKKEGFGEITGLNQFGKITLEKGKIDNLTKQNSKQVNEFFKEHQIGITGVATAEKITPNKDVVKAYDLQFFGPNVEEIGGVVKTDRFGSSLIAPVGFAGTKQ